MSNEVNQAFLRAYVKNRADRALQGTNQPNLNDSPSTGTPPMVRRDMPNRGDSLRIDQANQAAVYSTTPQSHGQPRAVPAPYLNHSPPKERAPELLRSKPSEPLNEQPGVWSPIGAERGMKGTNRTTSAPAVVVNAPSLDSVPNVARVGSRTLSSQSPAAPKVASSEAASQTKAIGPERESLAQQVSKLRIDAGHSYQKRPHSSELAIAQSFGETLQVAPSVVVNDHLNSLQTRLQTDVVLPHAPIMAGAGIASTKPEGLTSATTLVHSTKATSAPTTPTKPPVEKTNHRPGAYSRPMPQPGEIHSAATTPPEPKLQPPQYAPPALDRGTDRATSSRNTTSSNLPLPVAFSPSWEVDQFVWPDVLVQIQNSDVPAFNAISKHLKLANQDGLKVIAVTSGERGVGRSTIAMHLARCAAASGLNVALIDADGFYPSLVDQLKLDLEHGWQECLFENIPLEEVAVKSIEDNVTLFPLTSVIPTQQLHVNLHRLAKVVKRISLAYDMVFLDSNRLNLEQRDLIGISQDRVIDAAIVVTDSELSIKEKVDTAVSILHGMGIASVGIVQNFHS